MAEALVQVRDLVKQFPVEGSRDVVHAISGVDLDVYQGETLGLRVTSMMLNSAMRKPMKYAPASPRKICPIG